MRLYAQDTTFLQVEINIMFVYVQFTIIMKLLKGMGNYLAQNYS